jgi:hypothetical protein
MKLTNFVRLDIKSIVPTFGIKATIITIALFSAFLMFMDYVMAVKLDAPLPIVASGMTGMIVMTVTMAPFMLEIKNEINQFFITQNVTRESIVNGRYLFAVLMSLTGAVYSFLISGIILIIDGNYAGFKIAAIMSGMQFLVVLLYAAMSYPLYFKYGYAKSNLVATMVPLLFIVSLGIGVAIKFLQQEIDLELLLSKKGLWIIALIFVLVTVVLTYLSILLSRRFFAKRDL